MQMEASLRICCDIPTHVPTHERSMWIQYKKLKELGGVGKENSEGVGLDGEGRNITCT